MLDQVNKIANNIKKVMWLLEEAKGQVGPEHPRNELLDDALGSLHELETTIQATKDRILYASQLQRSIGTTCQDATFLTPSNIDMLKRLQKHSSSNIQSLVHDLNDVEDELSSLKERMEDALQDLDGILL